MKVSDVYGGFLEAEDLPATGEFEITLENVREANRKDKGQDGKVLDKPIVKIKGKAKEWVLNKTNARVIRRIHGNDMLFWVGKKITIYRTTCNAFGAVKPCIRVKETMSNDI